MIASMFTHFVTLHRTSNRLLEPMTAAQTMTGSISRQPPRASLLEVTATGTGEVYISGTLVGGGMAAETFTGPGTIRGRTQFATVAGLTTALSGGTVRVDMLDVGGNPQNALATIASGWPANLAFKSDTSRDTYATRDDGPKVTQIANWSLDYTDIFEPMAGDVIEEADTGDKWRVRTKPQLVRSPVRPLMWHCDSERLETGA